MVFEDVSALMPLQFFGLSSTCHYGKGSFKPSAEFRLPSTAEYLDEESFAEVYIRWNESSLSLHADVRLPFQSINEADFRRGDSLELFIDTRDMKSKAAVSKFCHHFVFFPVSHQGFFGREISRFRNEDSHFLCSPEDLEVSANLSETHYAMTIEIPAHCLFGYEPFSKLGFTYRINRAGGPPQHFSVSSAAHAIEQHPALWATLHLSK